MFYFFSEHLRQILVNHDHWVYLLKGCYMVFWGGDLGLNYQVPIPSGTLWLSLQRLSISYYSMYIFMLVYPVCICTYMKQVYRERGMRSYDDYTVHNFLLKKILTLPFKTQHWNLKMVWKRIQVIHCSSIHSYLSLGGEYFQEFHRWQILLAIYLPKLSAQSITS